MIYFCDMDDMAHTRYEFSSLDEDYINFINTLMDMNGIPFHFGTFSYDVELRQDLEIKIDFKKVFTKRNREKLIRWAERWEDYNELVWDGLEKAWRIEILNMINGCYEDDGEQSIYNQIAEILKGN